MATNPIGGPAAPVTLPGTLPPMPAVARILSRFDRDQLAGFIAVAIDLTDAMAGDPDLENATDLEDDHALSPQAIGYATGPGCDVADSGENAWVEWTALHPGTRKAGYNITAGEEDDEAYGDEEDGNFAEDEECAEFAKVRHGPGCLIADPDQAADDIPCDGETDSEREQMLGDVPMLPVFTLDTNIFTDERKSLGLSNLQSSFRTNSGKVRSADSGKAFRSKHVDGWRVPAGEPV